jgi:hypothetical protein
VDNEGEEVVMQIVMALNEHIQQENGITQALLEQQQAAKQSVAATTRPVLGRRVIYSHHISSPAKQKDIRKFALALGLGGYAKVGKPGVIVIEGAEAQCTVIVFSARVLFQMCACK